MPETLLRTKLFVPPVRPNLVSRPRLIQRLDQGLQLDRKLTLVSAPAGFGKTTLVSDWVHSLQINAGQESQNSNQIAWFSLDENDNEPNRFLTYLVAALNRVEGKTTAIGQRALAMLQSPQPPPAETVLTALVNDLAASPGRIILIIDDYHLIDSSLVDDALNFLLEHRPTQLHLAIATRSDPELPLARYRARGQLTELRAVDLRFTTAEAADFLNQTMGLALSAADIAALERRTEGWIAGLQLAAISMQGRQDTTSQIRSFTGSHRFVLDYLIEEVLDQQPENVQTFLLKTSVLSQLDGSLCDALTGRDDGQTTLETLEQANLFVVPLDDERRWYRYHHLFADLLRQRLRQTHAEEIPALHGRASEWYEQDGQASEAIRHALTAEDFERAAGLAELIWPSMSGSYQSIAWLGWLKALPDELVRTRPLLCLAYAWAYLNGGQLEAAEARLLDAERWLQLETDANEGYDIPSAGMVVVDKEQFRSLPVSLAAARAYHAQATGDVSATVIYARRVLELVPEGDPNWRSDVTALLGLAQWTRGELKAAHRTFSDGLAGMDPLDVIVGTFVLGDILVALGQLHTAISTYERSLRFAMAHGEPMPIGTEDVYSGISGLYREQGDLEAAGQALLTARKLGEQIELPDWQYRWCIAQARLMVSQGDLVGALDLLDEAERVYVRTPLPDVRPIVALKVRIWVAQGKLAEAQSWARQRNLSADDDLSYRHEFEHVTLVRLLIAQYRSGPADGAIQQAMGLLERLLQAADEGGRTGSVIEILVLQALAHEAQGHISPALVSLERALALAEPEGYVRIFVDEGLPMARLFNEALTRGIASKYVRRLLAAFPTAKPARPKPMKSQMPGSALVEPLSDREIEVLQLISEGLTNREIAARLYLSLNTVKVHTRNINGKLGVNNRMKAVARARALGILPAA